MQPAVSGMIVIRARTTHIRVIEFNFRGPPGISACDIKILTIIP